MGSEYKCKICQNKIENIPYSIKEMMEGTREVFEYFECTKCNTLQISKTPFNIADYYKDSYYSFSAEIVDRDIYPVRLIKSLRYKFALEWNFGYVRKYIFRKCLIYKWLDLLRVRRDFSILEVGCGNGHFLCWLANEGFTKLTGVDPYLTKSMEYENGVKLFNKTIFDLSEKFDLIILNHVFEHMENPLEAMAQIKNILAYNGKILLRIPVFDTYAWRRYGVNWVQIDAPRHLFIYSTKSMKLICDLFGLNIMHIEYDSNEFQFWGSEQYLRNIPLADPSSWIKNSKKSMFSKKQIKFYKEKSDELNTLHDGDMACFIISSR